MSLFEENENILTEIEDAESKLEMMKIKSKKGKTNGDKKEVALEIKSNLVKLVRNISKASGDVQKLGGALVLADLIEVINKYKEIFEIPDLKKNLEALEKMWEESK